MDASRLFKCRVLLVDDDPMLLQTTAAIVRSFGFSVRTAEDGFVELKILREVLPDIIISDLRMPNMSGFELLSVVRRRFPHLPTIGISGEFILSTMPLGLLVDHFFQKGEYTPGDLRAKMKELISDSPIRHTSVKPTEHPCGFRERTPTISWSPAQSAYGLPRFQTGRTRATCS